MISKRNKQILDFLVKKFDLSIRAGSLGDGNSYASIQWVKKNPLDSELVCEKHMRILETEGDSEDHAIKKMIQQISGKTLFKHKKSGWKKKAILPEFSSLAELKLKLMILSGEKEA